MDGWVDGWSDVLMTYCLLCWWERNSHPRVMGMAKHMAPNNERWDCHQFVNHILTAWGDLTFHAEPHRGCAWDQSEPAEPVGNWQCGQYQKGGEEFLGSNSRRLFYLNGSVCCRELKPSTQEEAGAALVPSVRRGVLLGNLFVGAEWGSDLWFSHLRSSQFHQMSKEHIGVDFHWRSYKCCPVFLKVYHFAFHVSVYYLSGTGFYEWCEWSRGQISMFPPGGPVDTALCWKNGCLLGILSS